VLYIEDNRVNQIVVESMLARLPQLEVALASDPAQGLEMAFARPPDLVLLDIQLPAMSGYEVLARLRGHPATRPPPRCRRSPSRPMPCRRTWRVHATPASTTT
jgi:diguanylate cyclase